MTERYPSPRSLLDKYDLRAKKSWGQNFLGDEGILDDIARLAAPRPGETVLELGAGLGHLTARLVARGATVVAVERDRDMARVLRGELGERITLLEADAARLDLAELAGRYGSAGGAGAGGGVDGGEGSGGGPGATGHGTRVTGTEKPGTLTGTGTGTGAGTSAAMASHPRLSIVGNLPYHLTSPILFSLLDQTDHVLRAVFLLQREVAERLAAPPGSRDWGILSVLLQREADVSVERIVPPGAFWPPPKVESAVLCALFRPPAHPIADPPRFRRLVKAGFAQRRKTLRNALEAGKIAPPDVLRAALAAAGVDPGRRGETLDLAEWAALDRALGPVSPSDPE